MQKEDFAIKFDNIAKEMKNSQDKSNTVNEANAKTIEELNIKIEELHKKNNDIIAGTYNKDAEVNMYRSTVAEKENEIQSKNERIISLVKSVEDRNVTIKEKNSIIEQLSDKLEKSLSEIKAMSSNVNNANGYIAINKKLKEEMLDMMAWQNEEVEIYYWNATVSLVVEKNNFYSDGQNVTYLMDNDTLAEVFPEMEC